MSTIQVRRDSAADWTTVNPVLAAGEIGYETDTGKFKIGDGANGWVTLPYQGGSGGGTSGVSTFQGRSGTVTLTKSDVTGTGLGTADLAGAVVSTNNGSDFVDKGTLRFNAGITALGAKLVSISPTTTLSGTGQSIDGATVNPGDRIFCPFMATGSQCGIYVAAAGAWGRPTDFPNGGTITVRQVDIGGGTLYAGSVWTLQNPGNVVIGTDAQVWDVPNVLTQSPGDNSKSPASTEFVATAITAFKQTLVSTVCFSSPAASVRYSGIKYFSGNNVIQNCLLEPSNGAPSGSSLTVVVEYSTNNFSTVLTAQTLTVTAGTTTPSQANPAITVAGPWQMREHCTSAGGGIEYNLFVDTTPA